MWLKDDDIGPASLGKRDRPSVALSSNSPTSPMVLGSQVCHAKSRKPKFVWRRPPQPVMKFLALCSFSINSAGIFSPVS